MTRQIIRPAATNGWAPLGINEHPNALFPFPQPTHFTFQQRTTTKRKNQRSTTNEFIKITNDIKHKQKRTSQRRTQGARRSLSSKQAHETQYNKSNGKKFDLQYIFFLLTKKYLSFFFSNRRHFPGCRETLFFPNIGHREVGLGGGCEMRCWWT